jgi:hypothetical protein
MSEELHPMQKYSPEKLEAMRSIGFNKSGQTKHNQAGVPIVKSSDTREEKITVDANNSVYKDNADGTQDLTLNPKAVRASFRSSV